MNFHEVRFPAPLSVGSSGGPERRTEIVTLRNGSEERNTPWRHSRRRYDAGLGVRSLDDLAEVTAFFEARQGQLFGFRWKDWADFKSCRPSEQPGPSDQWIGTGDGDTRTFALTKAYASGDQTYRRPITKPVAGSVVVAVAGVIRTAAGFGLDPATGVVTLTEAPAEGAAVTAGFEFDVPVRFDTDRIAVSVSGFLAGEIPAVPVIEVRV
ncbi:MAG: TIGR02217 family protein [Rhodovulum sulfidophilum]|uniref:TIGR02217 family protein n=1 Tax=Rhodovulum sulfidophilum TaxID=35806 RepID=A0A2W5NGP0_RHOSU|nr:MAG: TIGR02217 family protein [Rhodovulum sulfidophilum]